MLDIFETNYWRISHRVDSWYCGYLMVSSKDSASDLHQLSKNALNELGNVLAITEKLLILVYSPYKVLTVKLCFSPGFSCHFHMLLVTHLLLEEIKSHPLYGSDPDGVDAMLFVNREYCDKTLNQEQNKTILKTVAQLKKLSKEEIKYTLR